MKDAASNQVHHGMRAEEDMLSYSCNSEDAHYRHNVHRIGKKMSEQRLGIYACLCAFSCRHPARNAVRPTNMGPGFAEERQLRTLRSMIVWFTNPPGQQASNSVFGICLTNTKFLVLSNLK